ncbi:hypothetical protein DPEC_G00174770 [Dallia pectoralis]|uniref:Uncharacterized protein n=1 Tax=Dallia pectoralis TaxID=75939 RepID=A0ACC2GE67_DALPE|nr:hypothetical protein DPEC_G00174770 [Dallia pectoralis]
MVLTGGKSRSSHAGEPAWSRHSNSGYQNLNVGVGSATSDVDSTEHETDDKINKLTAEQQSLQDAVNTYTAKLHDIQIELNDCNSQINRAENELKTLIDNISSRDSKFAIFAAVCPFLGWMVDDVKKEINNPKDNAAISSAKRKLDDLQQRKSLLIRNEWTGQTELINNQMKLTRAAFDLGAVPDPVHLAEVQKYLNRIQDILLKLKSFWENIVLLLDNMENHTFAGNAFIESLQKPKFKKHFLRFLDAASTGWNHFKGGCSKVITMFSVQSKDAYKFLEISPSSLSKEEWQVQYDEVNAQLQGFYPALLAKQANEKEAIK